MGRPNPSRRALLAALSAGTASLAGCGHVPSFVGGEGSAEPRLERLHVVNCSPDPHTVHVTVERDGELAHWAAYDLAGRDDDGCPSVRVETEEWMETPGRWLVRARVDDHGEWTQAENSDVHGPCQWFEIQYDSSDPPGRRLGVDPADC